MMDVGRVCVKIAGRDAGGKCVVVDVLDNHYVLIDGQVRRRKCNVAHLEPTAEMIKIRKNAAHGTIVEEFKKMGIEIPERKSKPKTERPKKAHGQGKKEKKAAAEKPKKTKKAVKEEGIESKVGAKTEEAPAKAGKKGK